MNINQVWQNLLSDILKETIVRFPRGMITKEILNYNSTIDMNHPFLNITERDLGNAFRYAEAAWILSGDNRVKTISPFSFPTSSLASCGYLTFVPSSRFLIPTLSGLLVTGFQSPTLHILIGISF